nr:hypothetical protein [Deltaproteobacteria bacterium]
GLGMAYARGTCANGCLVGTGRDDACYGGGVACVEGSNYCGGQQARR